MPVIREQQDDLKVIIKGQKAGPGEEGDEIPDNVEIDMDPDEMEDILDSMTDNHSKGEEEADKKDMPDDIAEDDIDTNGSAIEKEMDDGGKKSRGEKGGDETESARGNDKKSQGGGGVGPGVKNVSKLGKAQPTYTWKQLMKRFISLAAKPHAEETYNKIHRSSVSGAVVASQMGGAAVKPGIILEQVSDSKLGFVIDSCGGGGSIGVMKNAMAEAQAMLKLPAFGKSAVTVVKYSGKNSMHKVIFAQDKAAEVKDAKEIPKSWPLKATDAVFSASIGAGTNFGSEITAQVQSMLAQKYNVIFFPDADIMAGANLVHFISLFKTHSKQVFVIFDSEASYVKFKQTVGAPSSNITYYPSH